MSAGTELDGADVRGFVLAVTAVLAAAATLLVAPGSGVGPATLAVMVWLAMLCAASWAALVDDGASTWHRIGAAVVAATAGAGFVAAVESAWALAIPGLVLAGAVGRRRSIPRFVALAAWLLATGYIIMGATLE